MKSVMDEVMRAEKNKSEGRIEGAARIFYDIPSIGRP